MNIDQLKKERSDLHQKRSALAILKRGHESLLSDIRSQVRTGGKMNQEKYRQCVETQNRTTKAMLKIEEALSGMKFRLREIEDLIHADNITRKEATRALTDDPPIESRGIIKDLVSLRQEYQEFAADPTRIASMRQMASEFVVKLNPIIKNALRRDS